MTTLEINFYNEYPRIVGNPYQNIVRNKIEFDDFIKKYGKHCDIYTSLYSFSFLEYEKDTRKIIYGKPLINKIFFDFDGLNSLEDVKKLHNYCKNLDLIHRIHFSGGGFHFFIITIPDFYPKDLLKAYQLMLIKNLNLNCDKKIIGDIHRIFRIHNSFNFKKNISRYCIAINPNSVENNNIDYFINKAKQPNYENNIYCGSKFLNLWEYQYLLDESFNFCIEDEINFEIVEKDINIEYKKIIDLFPSCIKNLINIKELHGTYLFLLVLYLKSQLITDIPLFPNEIVGILKNVLNPNEFEHYFGKKYLRNHDGHEGKKFKYIMKNDYFLFPSCNIFKKLKLCDPKCLKKSPLI